jgi:F0F1-type ATP synthase membrane subunit a
MLEQSIFAQIFGMVTGLNMLIVGFFIIFEGCLQAFVFSMIAITYLNFAIHGSGH